MKSTVSRLGPADHGHGRRATRRRAVITVTAVAVSMAAASASGGSLTVAVTRSTSTPPGFKPVNTLPAPSGGAGVTVFGEVAIPQGQPGQLFVVLARPVDSAGHMPIVVRNNRDVTVYDVNVRLVGSDASGAVLGVAEYFIVTAGLAPGDWVFGQNAVPAPALGGATEFQLQLGGSEAPTAFVGLEVPRAEIGRGGVIEGTVVNSSPVTLSDFIMIDVACFDSTTITSYESVMPDLALSRLGPGEAAHFATTKLVDPAACTAIAVQAIGAPEQ